MIKNIQEEIEDKIIDYINFGASSRLVIVKSEEKGFEDYLIVGRKGKYKENVMYFDINSFVLPAKESNFIKDFSEKSFRAEKNFYLIFTYFDEPKQKINDYIWLIPALDFKDIADIGKDDKGETFLRFESSSDIKKQNKYSKFLVDVKTLGNLILDAYEKGEKLDYGKMGIQEKREVKLESVKEFLCNARHETYASGSGSIETPQFLESKQFDFQKGGYFYRDVFFNGEKRIIGQEIIYQDAKPIFGMSYIGTQLGRLETDFLKESLYRLFEKCRLGEVCEYEKREYKYVCHGKGSLDEFSGEEEIFLNGKSIYKLTYQGGIL